MIGEQRYPHLFSPLDLGFTTIKNRAIMEGMIISEGGGSAARGCAVRREIAYSIQGAVRTSLIEPSSQRPRPPCESPASEYTTHAL